MIDQIRAFSGGYCRQLLAMVDRKSWRLVRFPAVFFALHHRRVGWIVVDTGYGGNFHPATTRFPARLYRWATPTHEVGSASALLATAGIVAQEVGHVLITHFHGDHVGGLSDFPQAVVHFRADALQPLQALPPWRQVRAAFLKELIPDWLPTRAAPIPSDRFISRNDVPFASHDLLGDGSVILLHLPGHAPGQLGLLFEHAGQNHLYAADAYWRKSQLTDGIEPFGLAMSLQWDADAYRETVRSLRDLHRGGVYRITACHDEGAQAALDPSA